MGSIRNIMTMPIMIIIMATSMSTTITRGGWSFADRSRTSAEIVVDFYRAIREAAGDAVVIGCNTFSHLCAGLVEVTRTGDDTSGRYWDRTRKMGVNTLAFRIMQNRAFYMADADCIGITDAVPWEQNRVWLKALSRSGSPLFMSSAKGVADETMLPEIRAAVGDRLKIFVDGGVRSGADVFKCLALGADAVLIGRPYVIAAHGGGTEGVELYTRRIMAELREAMMMTDCRTLSDITEKKIRMNASYT